MINRNPRILTPLYPTNICSLGALSMSIFRVRSAFLPHGVSLLSIRISHRAPKNSHNTATKGPFPQPNAHSLEPAQERCQSGSLSQFCARVETNLVGLQAVNLSSQKWLTADQPLNYSNGPPYLHHFARVKFTNDAWAQPFEDQPPAVCFRIAVAAFAISSSISRSCTEPRDPIARFL